MGSRKLSSVHPRLRAASCRGRRPKSQRPPRSEWSRILREWLLERASRNAQPESIAALAKRAQRELGFGSAGKISELIPISPEMLQAWRDGNREVVLQFVHREAVVEVDLRSRDELIKTLLQISEYLDQDADTQTQILAAINTMSREQILAAIM